MEEKHQKNFLNTAEVSDMLGISPATLRKWRATDTGPRFYKFNRSVFYKREDIEAWISEHYMLVEPKNREEARTWR